MYYLIFYFFYFILEEKTMKKILPLLIFFIIGCNSVDPILEYQQKLISDEVTGSNIFKLVKNEGNLIFNFENAVDKVADHHNVNKDDLEEYFDLEIGEQTGE